MRFRKIKKDDVVIALPSKNRVRVINILNSYIKETWLKNYWHEHYDITLPAIFEVAVCQFATNSTKNYDYPIYKMCLKKPFRQKKARKLWADDREQHIADQKMKLVLDDVLKVNRRDIAKAREEINKNARK